MAPRNPALKRRTDMLFDEETGTTPGSGKLFGLSADIPQLVELPITQISRNPDQPRKTFDEAEIDALAASIHHHGLQNPIIVTRIGRNDYRLVGGERRLRAHEKLGRTSIFAIITKADPEEIAIIDNVLRVDLNAVELASALARLAESHGYTHEQLGSIIGRDQSDVTKILSILRLPAEIIEAYLVAPTAVSRSILIEIAAIGESALQQELWRQACAGATVKALREAKRQYATLPETTEIKEEGETNEAAALEGAPEEGTTPEEPSLESPPSPPLNDRRLRQRMAGSLRRLEKDVGELITHQQLLDHTQRQRLEALRRQIDQVLTAPSHGTSHET